MGPDKTLYIYSPDEILSGAVPFYTGRCVEEIYDRSLLLNVLDGVDQIFIVSMGKRGDDGQERGPGREMTSMGGVYLLARRKVDDGRVYSLFTNKGSGSFEKDDQSEQSPNEREEMFVRRNGFLPFSKPSIGREEIDEVVDTLRSGWITTGLKTQRFEGAFGVYVGCRHAVGLSSATGGLHTGLTATRSGLTSFTLIMPKIRTRNCFRNIQKCVD